MGRSRHIKPRPNISNKLKLREKKPQLGNVCRNRLPQLRQHAHEQKQLSPDFNIPFSPDEQILLIGEADLSFARSLIQHHGCTKVTATVYESESVLLDKYPHVDETIRIINNNEGRVHYGVDATNMKPWSISCGKRHRKTGFESRGTMERIIFNFPHVGGKSKDVNRQVRYNQELLVSFFKHAIPFLSASHGSSIIVTIFEGEPYTLWNIRDLARHCCLEVARSFKFQSRAYPGYKHSRTLGIVKNKNGEEGGGWKGEERPARTFVFVRKGEGQFQGARNEKNKHINERENSE